MTAEFAHRFSRHFEKMTRKYTIYAELQNVFDLALVAGLLRHEDLSAQLDWSMNHVLDPHRYEVRLGHIPKAVDTVVSHRVINNRTIVAGISGGVYVNTKQLMNSGIITANDQAELAYQKIEAGHGRQADTSWWWDAP